MKQTELKPLLPCPFCGGKAEDHNDVHPAFISCMDCGAETAYTGKLCDPAIRAAKWNTRQFSVDKLLGWCNENQYHDGWSNRMKINAKDLGDAINSGEFKDKT